MEYHFGSESNSVNYFNYPNAQPMSTILTSLGGLIEGTPPEKEDSSSDTSNTQVGCKAIILAVWSIGLF